MPSPLMLCGTPSDSLRRPNFSKSLRSRSRCLVPSRADLRLVMPHSDQNKPSLLTLGVMLIAFVPVDQITPVALSIFQNAKKVIADLSAQGVLPPGLKEQYDVQLHRLQPGSGSGPQCEFLCFPGVVGRPSMYFDHCDTRELYS